MRDEAGPTCATPRLGVAANPDSADAHRTIGAPTAAQACLGLRGDMVNAFAPDAAHGVEVRGTSIDRLVAAGARAHRVAADDPRTRDIRRWAVGLPHDRRVARLRELGERTDDIYLRLAEMLLAHAGWAVRR